MIFRLPGRRKTVLKQVSGLETRYTTVQMASEALPTLHLYSYFRSSCTARLRIATAFKGISVQYHYVNLPEVRDPNHPSYHSYRLINPNGTVPTLVAEYLDGSKLVITQSLAALDYLEETFLATPSLLPPLSDPASRAHVRELVSLVAIDLQPRSNTRIQQQIASIGGDPLQWAQEVTERVFDVCEKLLEKSARKYSVGDEVSLADVLLAPAVANGIMWGLDITRWKTLCRVWNELDQLEAFRKGHWRRQKDTPEDLRLQDA